VAVSASHGNQHRFGSELHVVIVSEESEIIHVLYDGKAVFGLRYRRRSRSACDR
jgi:hypothetical protein